MAKRILLIMVALFMTGGVLSAQQVADLKYAPPIPRPAYLLGQGPRVVVDAAHHNYHTADGRYKPFAKLLRRDGYRVDGLGKPLSADSLRGVDVLVIANALHKRNVKDWSLPTPSAFTQTEVRAVHTWVKKGGSLLLIADHMPFPGAAADLAKAFGVRFSNGYAKPAHRVRGKADVFDRTTGLQENAITRGRPNDKRVTKVATFGGSAFQPPKNATPIIVFGAKSMSFETKKAPGITSDAPQVPIAKWCQAAVFPVGKGRVAVFGEAAMFTAQLAGQKQRRMGMNAPEANQNHQLLLNVMHWLSRAKGMPD